MSSTEEHNSNVSEEYQKYLIQVIYNNKELYTINGTDLDTEDEEDKVLVDEHNKFLLFTTVDGILSYLKTSNNLFDDSNFNKWLSEITTPITPYNTINFDTLNNKTLQIDTYENYDLVVSAQNLASDYFHQVENDPIIDILVEYPLQTLFDTFIDTYVMEDEKSIKPSKKLKADSAPKLQQVYQALQESITIK